MLLIRPSSHVRPPARPVPLGVLQSRLAAALAATIFIIPYIFILYPSGALASEFLQEIGPREISDYDLDLGLRDTYEPSFAAFDSSYLGRRATVIGPLENNKVVKSNLESGKAACYQLKKGTVFGGSGSGSSAARGIDFDTSDTAGHTSSEVDMLPRQDGDMKVVYISANTCLQPFRVARADNASIEPPQLTLLISNSSQLGCPDSSMENMPGVQKKTFDGGAVTFKMNFTDDLYISVQAQNVSVSYQGVYFFELAASVDEFYHRYESKPGQLLWLDSDASSALLVSKNLTADSEKTKDILSDGAQYQFYIDNELFPRLHGVRHSTCGLQTNAQIYATPDGKGNLNNLVHMTMTTRGPGGLPKQQFYVTGLNDTTLYRGIIVKVPNTKETGKRDGQPVPGGGGVVFNSTTFNTVSGTSCKMVTNLDFCDDIQYAIPGNTEKFKDDSLGKKYDDYAKEMYDNFEKALMQVQCEAPSTKMYSLMKGCDDCRKAYKKWLCTVVMPRCEDFTSDSPHTIVRNAGQAFPNGTKLSDNELAAYSQPVFNTSRNKFIDDQIAPGPYKELLPCDDLCYEVVQSCPAALKFACPLSRFREFNSSYGKRNLDDKDVTCNYPGEPRTRVGAAANVAFNTVFLAAMVLLSIALLQ